MILDLIGTPPSKEEDGGLFRNKRLEVAPAARGSYDEDAPKLFAFSREENIIYLF